MPELIDKNALICKVCNECQHCNSIDEMGGEPTMCKTVMMIAEMPTIEPEVRHGRWIECDYKHLEHGFMETEPKAGLCCSECRAAFQKKKMTYKQYCAACGARMDEQDGGAENG